MVLQNYQNLIEMTSNIIDIVAFGVGFKCPRKIHLNTQGLLQILCRDVFLFLFPLFYYEYDRAAGTYGDVDTKIRPHHFVGRLVRKHP